MSRWRPESDYFVEDDIPRQEPLRAFKNPAIPHDAVGRAIWFDEDGVECRIETAKWIRAREKEQYERAMRRNATVAELYRYQTLLEEGQDEFQYQRKDVKRKKRKQTQRRRQQSENRRRQLQAKVHAGFDPPSVLLGPVAEGQTRLTGLWRHRQAEERNDPASPAPAPTHDAVPTNDIGAQPSISLVRHSHVEAWWSSPSLPPMLEDATVTTPKASLLVPDTPPDYRPASSSSSLISLQELVFGK